jgi:nucleotide-binding universal stress UspA family protein
MRRQLARAPGRIDAFGLHPFEDAPGRISDRRRARWWRLTQLQVVPRRTSALPAFEHILCPVDLSERSVKALKEAVLLARLCGATVTALYVQPVVSPYVPLISGLDEELRSHFQAELDGCVSSVLGSGVPIRTVLRAGDPATTILEEVRAAGADLVVMGTHARKGLLRLILGSVTERVVRHAPCPVLAVPAGGEPKREGRRSRTLEAGLFGILGGAESHSTGREPSPQADAAGAPSHR